MEQYYRKVQEMVLVQRDIICSLLKDPRIIGDYYEAIVRDAIKGAVSRSFDVGRGVVLAPDGRSSKECDIIIYSAAEYGPLFTSGDIVVVSPEAVRCVIQVKGTVSLDNMGDSIGNLSAVDALRPGIWKVIVGFKTNVNYQSLVQMCAKSHVVNGIFVFPVQPRMKLKISRSSGRRWWVSYARLRLPVCIRPMMPQLRGTGNKRA